MPASIYRLLNTQYKTLSEDAGPEKNWYEIIRAGLDDNSLEGLYKSKDLDIYVDESGMNNQLPQNESLAYLMYALNRFIGLLYGPAVIVAKTAVGKRKIEGYFKEIADGKIPYDDDNDAIKAWNAL